MRLYHGGTATIEKPQLLTSAITVRTTDFGNGFYTTTSLEQAERWVKIRRSRHQISGGVVSIFETENDLFDHKELNCLIFKSADEQWLNFVMKNRMNMAFSHEYDVVAGPVANDNVYVVLTLFERGLLDVAEVLHRLKTYKLADQILFHTDKSLRKLTYIGSEEIP
ncbi:MAG: DUF3990 domain-containing protein [Planctomycetaceae bacterium]|jgi:hypothetical protein|nr:DUF3990 domain-containing protein [Planctomycetaceae bacterium]